MATAQLALVLILGPKLLTATALDTPDHEPGQAWQCGPVFSPGHDSQTNVSATMSTAASVSPAAPSTNGSGFSSTLPMSTCPDETQGPYATLAGSRWEAAPGWSCPGDDLAEFNVSTLAKREVALRFCAWLCREAPDCLAIALQGRRCRLRSSGQKSVTLDESCKGGRWDSTGNYYTMLQRVCLKDGPFDGVWLEERGGRNYTHRIQGTTLSWEDSFETALNFSSNSSLSFTTRLGRKTLHAHVRQDELVWRSNQRWKRLGQPHQPDSEIPHAAWPTSREAERAAASSNVADSPVNVFRKAKLFTSGCLLRPGRFSPLDMADTAPSYEASWEGCQQRCLGTPGCEHFSMLVDSATAALSGKCHLQDGTSHFVANAPGYRSGPKSCSPKESLNISAARNHTLPGSFDCQIQDKCYGPAFNSAVISLAFLKDAMPLCRELCAKTSNCSSFCFTPSTRNCSLSGPAAKLGASKTSVGGRLSCGSTSRKFLISEDDQDSLLGLLLPGGAGLVVASSSLLAVLAFLVWTASVRCSTWLPRLLGLPRYHLPSGASLSAPRSARYISLPLEEELSDFPEDDLYWD